MHSRFCMAFLSFSSPGAAVLFFLKEEKEKNGGAENAGDQWSPLRCLFWYGEKSIGAGQREHRPLQAPLWRCGGSGQTVQQPRLHLQPGRLRLSKNMRNSWMTEQQGKSEGGKEPPSRSINQFFELFQSSKNCLSGAKRLFRHAEQAQQIILLCL